MAQNIELGEQIGELSADIKLFAEAGSGGTPRWIKAKLNASDRIKSVLSREVDNEFSALLDTVVSAIRYQTQGEISLSVFPSLQGYLSFEEILSQSNDLQPRLELAKSLASFVSSLHYKNIVAGVLDPDALFYQPDNGKFFTINSWNLAFESEHSSDLISDLRQNLFKGEIPLQ